MKKRYPNSEHTALLDQLIASALNLLSTIYARVYFPTYSNGLKDVARHLGFRWSEPTASGLVALAWRREWEHSQQPDLKQMLATYNAEDCTAAQIVAEALSALSQSAAVGNADVVDVATLKREYPQRIGNIEFALPEFRRINDAARWNHQRDKVYARSNKRLARLRRNAPTAGWTVPINKVVECEEQRPMHCTGCGAATIYRWGRLSRTVYDFKLSGAGIKRWVVMYSFPRYICWQCKMTFHQYAHQAKSGNALCPYAVYQIIDLQITQSAVTKGMRSLFGIPASPGMVNRLKANVAERCELSILRTALNLGRKSTPPKVEKIPYFPITREKSARQGFLTDEQYTKLRDALPDYLKRLFVTAYFTGVRLGELLAWRWEQIDWEQGFVTLQAEETKSGYARVVPVLAGDMRRWLEWAREQSNECPHVFNQEGRRIKEFRSAWTKACKTAEVPDLSFPISGALPSGTCAAPESLRSSACASPAIELIRWSVATIV
jgi:hypothetical protein